MFEFPQTLPDKPVPDDYVSIRRFPAKAGLETMTAHYVRQSFKPHAHDEYVIGIIEEGAHSVWCRGEHFRVPAGTVVTMHPGDVHYGGPAIPAGWKQRMIYLSEEKMRRFVTDANDDDKEPVTSFHETFHNLPALASSFAHFHEVLHSSSLTLARDVALDALMQTIIGTLAPSILERRSSNGPDGRIRDAVEFLCTHAEHDVSLDSLCEICGLRRRQTIEAFKRITGLPPHAYHIIQKVKAVKKLLGEGVSPAIAAVQAGFADQSHMARHFGAIVGMTPGAYSHALS